MPTQSATSTPTTGTDALAPAHLGELTQLITPSLVDEVLHTTGRMQHRIRKLPSRVMVYFVLALSLMADLSYRGVWAYLTANLPTAPAAPSGSAMTQARRRLGPRPLIALFGRLKGPVAPEHTPGCWWRGLRLVAWDGTTLQVPDSPANATAFGHHPGPHPSSYPMMQISALVECTTRALIEVVAGPLRHSELSQAYHLCSALQPGMLHLADRGYASWELMEQARATGAHLLWRVKATRVLPVLQVLPDGSWISMMTSRSGRDRLRRWGAHAPLHSIEGVRVRVIQAQIRVVDADTGGVRTSTVRVVTTLLDAQRYPAQELVEVYHQRWEIERVFYGLKVTVLGSGRVLRSQLPRDVIQELYGLFVLYQAVRCAGADIASQAGVAPDRVSLTVVVRTVRLSVATADRGPGPGAGSPVWVRVSAAVLDPRELGPGVRRPRVCPRRVKCPQSKFAYNATRNERPVVGITIEIAVEFGGGP